MSKIMPLNGSKTHPLSEHAIGVLRDLAKSGPKPRQEFNPGVINRLFREDLIANIMLPSPYTSHKGGKCEHVRITDEGRAAIA